MTDRVKEFLESLRWDTQIESGNQFKMIYENRKMDIPDAQFKQEANRLGYHIQEIGKEMIITRKRKKIFL